jgi:lipoprotein-releasing system permease protein
MLFLAIRHLLSRKRQTLLILFGISLGTMIFVAISGIQLGFRNFIIAKLIENDAHVKISGHEELISPETINPIFFSGDDKFVSWVVPPAGKRDEARILYPQGWFDRLDENAEVLAYAPQFTVQAIFRRGGVKFAGQLIGINVERQLRVSNIKADMKEGRIETLSTGGSRIVLGSGLAKKIGAQYGETIFVSTGTGRSQPFKIVGLYESGVQQLDDMISYGAITDVQQLNATHGRVTNIAVRLLDVERAQDMANQWSLTGRDKVQSWSEANAGFLQIFKIQDIVRNFISITVLIVAAFGIYNVLTIIINQKKREIAILRALGFSPKEIERLFLLQGGVLGLLGAAVGLTLGFLLCLSLTKVRFQGIGFDRFMISFDLAIYAQGLLMAFVAAILAGYFPAHAARKMTPVDIIRSEA